MLLIFEVLDRFVNGEPGVKKHKSESEIEEKIETESSVASPSQTENEDTLSTANEGVLVLEPIDSLLVLDPTDSFLTHFYPSALFLYPLKTSENFWIPYVFSEDRNGTLGYNGSKKVSQRNSSSK